MARHGMGAVYTRTLDGKPLRSGITEGERQALIDAYYDPHHRKFSKLADASCNAQSLPAPGLPQLPFGAIPIRGGPVPGATSNMSGNGRLPHTGMGP
jgi:hypothetical protein